MTKQIDCVIVGQTYALTSIRIFLNFVRKCIDEDGLQIKIHYYGRSSLSEVDLKFYEDFIINKGWVHPSTISEEIKNYDFAFLPYFEEDNQIVGKMSFPSKLIVYASALLPVLYVGEKKSSPALIISNNKIGMVFSQLEFLKYFNSTLFEDMSKLKDSGDFKTRISELNKELFSRKNFRETLSNLKILSKGIQNDQKNEVFGVKNNTKDLFFMNRIRDAAMIRQNFSLRFFMVIKEIFNRLNFNFSSSSANNGFSEKVSCVRIKQNKDGNTEYQLTLISYFNESAYEEKVGVFSDTRKNTHKMQELVGNNNVIVLSSNFKKSQGNLSNDNLIDVIRQLSPKDTNITILVKQYVHRVFLFNTKKLLIRKMATLADFYILGLLSAQNIVMSSDMFFKIVLKYNQDEESGKLLPIRLVSNIFSSIQDHHIHDPRIQNFFRINFRKQQFKFGVQDLKEIYQKSGELDLKSTEQPDGKQRTLERFVGLLYLLGKNENDIRNFLLNHIESNKLVIDALILSGKPMRKFYIFKRYIL